MLCQAVHPSSFGRGPCPVKSKTAGLSPSLLLKHESSHSQKIQQYPKLLLCVHYLPGSLWDLKGQRGVGGCGLCPTQPVEKACESAAGERRSLVGQQPSPLPSSPPQLQQGQFFQRQAGRGPSSQPRLTSPPPGASTPNPSWSPPPTPDPPSRIPAPALHLGNGSALPRLKTFS